MRTSILLALCFLVPGLAVSAQGVPLSSPKFTVEAGIEVFSVQRIDKPYIRADYPAQGYLSGGIGGSFATAFAGAKAEVLTHSKRFGFSAGLRYTSLNSTIGKHSFFNDYFYLLHRQAGTTTEYLTIRMLEEKSHYIGVPLEVRFFPAAEGSARWYINTGGELAHRVANSLDMYFGRADMTIFEDDVKRIVGSASQWYTWMYAGGGIRMGAARNWTIGMNVPIILSEDISSLNKPRPAIGLHVQGIIWTKAK